MRDAYDDLDRDRELNERIERDYHREPRRSTRPQRPSDEEFRIRSLRVGFVPAPATTDTTSEG